MGKADKTLIMIVLGFSLLVYLSFSLINQKHSALIAEISVNGQVISTIDLDRPPSEHMIYITGPLGKSVAEIRKGAIRMKFSPCPNHYCMQSGWINRAGQSIVCIPNRIIIKIIANND